MSYFADYKKEREGKETIETPEGFATYVIQDHQCYIEDIYVAPGFRRNGAGSKIADLILQKARESHCTELLGSVVPSTNGSTESMKALLAYGFKLHSSVNNFIWFSKEIV